MENLNEHELWIENKSNKSLREIYMITPVSYFIKLIQKKQKEGLNIKENQLLDYMYEQFSSTKMISEIINESSKDIKQDIEEKVQAVEESYKHYKSEYYFSFKEIDKKIKIIIDGKVKNILINIENLPFSDFISKSELFTTIKNGNEIIDKRLEIIKDYVADRPYIKPSYFEDFQKIYTNAKEISNIQSVKPKNALMLNNKLSLELTKDFINQGEQSINVAAKNKAPVTIYASMNYNDKNISLSRNFTAYDREIHNAVISLYVAGNTTFTADMVYRAMNGLTNSEKVSPQAIEVVTQSIEKSRVTKLTINVMEHVKQHNLKLEKATYDDMLLSARKIEVTVSGVTKQAYVFHIKPFLYEYAQSTRQIISVPIKLLNIKDILNNSEEITVLKNYLIRRIEVMKDNDNQGNNTSYESIFREIDINKENLTEGAYKTKTKVIRQHIKKILEYWIKNDYIKKYEDYKEGKSIIGLKIHY